MTAAFVPIWILGAGFVGLMLLSLVFSGGHMITGGYVAGVEPYETGVDPFGIPVTPFATNLRADRPVHRSMSDGA